MARHRPHVQIKRIYEAPAATDGTRVLVDRIWPRGMSKERARLDLWCKQVAPSTELRRWYGHDPAKFAEFAHRYRGELADPERAEGFNRLRALAGAQPMLTLLTATKDVTISEATVLAEEIRSGDP